MLGALFVKVGKKMAFPKAAFLQETKAKLSLLAGQTRVISFESFKVLEEVWFGDHQRGFWGLKTHSLSLVS